MEAAGVELFSVLTACKLLILRMARRVKKAPLPIPLYVYCTKIFSRFHSAKPDLERSIPHFCRYRQSIFRLRSLFSGSRNLPYSEPPDSRDLNQLVQQEIFIPGFLDVLDHGKEPLPLFLPAQTTFAQDDQTRMNRLVEKFDEVPRVRRDDRESWSSAYCQTT